MLVPPPQLQEGQREEAILVDASTGVAGRVRPGDLVDVIASYAAEQGAREAPRAGPTARS